MTMIANETTAKGTAKKRGKRRGEAAPGLPTPERERHDPIRMVEERDPDGWPVAHCRTMDTLSRLVRAGLLHTEWASAGDRFRRDFHQARFDPLSVIDLRRARGAGGREAIIDRVEDARQRVWESLYHLGGLSTPGGSVVWHVIGAEMSLRDWSLRQSWGAGKAIRHEMATGILVSALGALSAYYTQARRGRRPARAGER